MDIKSVQIDVNTHENHGYEDDNDHENIHDLTNRQHEQNGAVHNVSRDISHDVQDQHLLRKRKSSKKRPEWDVFGETSKDPSDQSNLKFWKNVFIVTRVVFVSLFAVIVCITAVVSKLTLVFMLTNINAPKSITDGSLKTYNNSVIYPATKTEVTWIWAVLLCMLSPYVFTLIKSLNRLLFKSTNPIQPVALVIALVVETVHSIGLFILVFLVLPNLDPIVSSIVILNVGTVPGLLKIFYPTRNRLPHQKDLSESKTSPCKIFSAVTMNIFIAILHVGGLGLTCYYILNPPKSFVVPVGFENQRRDTVILLITASIFISINWWENFVPKGREYSNGLPKLKRYFMQSRSKILFISMCWKIILSTCILPVIYGSILCGQECIDFIYFKHSSDLEVSVTSFVHTTFTDGTLLGNTCTVFNKWFPFMISLIYILMNGICYKIGKAACKVVSQKIAFGLPLTISIPTALAILIEMMSPNSNDMDNVGIFYLGKCKIQFPYWSEDGKNPILHLSDPEVFLDIWPLVVGGVLSYFSLLLITNYIWSPKKERLQPTDKLFVKPLYCGILLDQSFMLNRRRTDDEYKTTVETITTSKLRISEWPDDPEFNPSEESSAAFLRRNDTPMIYMCATMWHENTAEMTQVLKSICRVDEDQCARRNLMMFLGIQDPDYYECEAHIFFDDAFEPHGDDIYEYTVNGFVKNLVDCIDTAASAVHNRPVAIGAPTKIPTPYGGQLIWKLPGGNKIIAHLKDKQKIRHKKRWSQVMYMYYFLGHKLMNLKKSRKAKEIIAQNTFLLALDGDVDFQPSAVQLLVDRMKKNLNVGAACGRIHPIGGGPMIWYQKFEYAVSHWLQKAAENMIGCVLCSPGCFSLFRGSSLMDDNVMRKYTSLPVQAYQHVQYDQGEDRWLCTLLLQQGYKVEYVAASDALTFAPEGFYEFYNQRRRWSPSTMANIIDLLMDWKNVTKKNDDISLLCVGYQMLLLASSLLTPGTILLMVLGALYIAFDKIQPWTAFVVNLVPVVIMVVLCFVARKEVQLSYAAILSTLYALIMMIVMIGLLKEAVEAGFCSVTTWFLMFVASAFVISALLHPQEIWCILHGLLYFLAIPSMSMLMMIYALGNLHDISWGTRDAGTPAPNPNTQTQHKSKLNDIRNWIMGPTATTTKQSSEYQFSFGNLFRCMCCPQSGTQTEDMRLRAILDRLDDMETKMTTMSQRSIDSFHPYEEKEEQTPFSQQMYAFEGAGEVRNNPSFIPDKQAPRDELKRPFWIEDPGIKNGKIEYLEEKETSFWKSFIEKYLKPLDYSESQKKQFAKDLLQLRNKVCLAFLLMNALFVTIVYTLTEVNKQEKGTLSIPLPCPGLKTDKGYGPGHIEPISFAFTAVFGIMLLVQFICMLFHRYSTLLHVIASTEINLDKKVRDTIFKADDDKPKEIGVDEGLELVRQMQSTQNDADSDTSSVYSFKTDTESVFGEDTIGPNKGKDLWKKIAKRRNDFARNTLSKTFMKNFSKLQKVVDAEDNASTNPAITEEMNKNPDDMRINFVRAKFGTNRLTNRSMKTMVTMIQNEGIKEQIRRKTEHMQKLKQMEKEVKTEKIKSRIKGAMDKLKDGKPSFVDIVARARSADKIAKYETEIEKMKSKVVGNQSNDQGECLPSVEESLEQKIDSDESLADSDEYEVNSLSDDRSNDSYEEISTTRPRGTGSMSNADVLF